MAGKVILLMRNNQTFVKTKRHQKFLVEVVLEGGYWNDQFGLIKAFSRVKLDRNKVCHYQKKFQRDHW